jgi:hypothetical protein
VRLEPLAALAWAQHRGGKEGSMAGVCAFPTSAGSALAANSRRAARAPNVLTCRGPRTHMPMGGYRRIGFHP